MDQLSREQVESLYFDTNEVVRRTILVHDAIQRARIEVLEQDLNDKEKAINEVQQTAREICKDLDDRIADLTAERDRLREALQPFAKVGDALGNTRGIVEWLWIQSHTNPLHNVGIHISHIRNAQAALRGEGG